MWAFSGGSVLPGLDFVLRGGSTGVSLFLVLSGLCLYLPYAGGRSGRFNTRDFLARRLHRLLPAYYVTLVLALGLHLVADGRWGLAALSGRQYAVQALTHMTLTHQLFPETFYGLNGAYWSLGLEWELYLTMPLLVVAAIRWGLPRTAMIVLGITAVYRVGLFVAVQEHLLPDDGWSNVVLGNLFLGRWSEFVLGMLAAELFRTRTIRVTRAMVGGCVAALGIALSLPENPLNHILYGFVFFTLVSAVLVGDNVAARVFSWRPLVAVGVMSYSLYLVHQPIIEVIGGVLGASGTGTQAGFLWMLAALPCILAASLVLFALVERHGMSTRAGALPGLRALLFPPKAVLPDPAGNENAGTLPPIPARSQPALVPTPAQEGS